MRLIIASVAKPQSRQCVQTGRHERFVPQ
jgi:hypothetical protein